MVLLTHIVFAFGSMACATLAFFSPSRLRIRAGYALVGFTFASGFWLIFTAPVHMAEVCATGLVYVAYVSCALLVAQKKMAKITISTT